jgi:hypothetical protein
MVFEGKKTPNMDNIEGTHALEAWVGIEKDTIILGWALSPSTCSLYLFTVHATSPTQITWGVKSDSGQRKE